MDQSLKTASAKLAEHLYGPWGLALLIALYLLPGLVGHDPWRGNDVQHFVTAFEFSQNRWALLPMLVGEPITAQGPLYYWVCSLFISTFGQIISLHDAARLTTTLFASIAIFWCARASSHLYGKQTRTAAALLMLGTLGLVTLAHENQPGIAFIAMQAITLSGLGLLPKHPLRGALQATLGTILAFLSKGLIALLLSAPVFILIAGFCPQCRTPRCTRALVLAFAFSILCCAVWPFALGVQSPELLEAWWDGQWQSLLSERAFIPNFSASLQILSWFTWPLWPIACWSLWQAKQKLFSLPWFLPISVVLLALFVITPSSPSDLLPVIPPLVLLAAAGIPSLRRGAANAFDWFGIMTFGVFATLVWLAWSAQVINWPFGLARSLARMAPEFTPPQTLFQPVIGLVVCLTWLVLVLKLPRTLNRGPANWAMGMTMLWCLAVALLSPWFDHGRSYRPLAESLAQELQDIQPDCISGMGINNSQRASLWYFSSIEITRSRTNTQSCHYLLLRDEQEAPSPLPSKAWKQRWQYQQGGGKRLEVFRLYQR